MNVFYSLLTRLLKNLSCSRGGVGQQYCKSKWISYDCSTLL